MIIDSDNYKAAGIEVLFFPGGEPHVKLPDISGDVTLFLKLRTWNDAGIAAALIDAICYQDVNPSIFIPYFPGARQDRTDGKSPLTIAMTTQLLQPMRGELSVFDVHSDIFFNYVSARNFMPSDLMVPVKPDVVAIIVPDAGAKGRAESFRHAFYPHVDLIQCDKKRDFQSGKFIGFEMPSLTKQGRYLIVDDICDGGGTFNLLAAAFESDPVGKYSRLELFVSHGIFSKGLDAISPTITHITTTNSWCQLTSDRLTVLPLEPLLQGASRV